MRIASIRPSTLDGIKQLAKKIKREHSITHTDALELASRKAGFEGFAHARRQFAKSAGGSFPVYLTVYWRVPRRDAQPGMPRWGREHLRVDLGRPLNAVVAKHRVKAARGLVGFRVEYEDHLEHDTDVLSQESAREMLLEAERSLRFMEATGLQPASTQAQRNAGNRLREIPGRDHTSTWFDPTSGSVLLLDEPYSAAVEGRRAERSRWAAQHGAAMMEAPPWEGIYYPGECAPYLLSKDSDLIARTAAALSKLAPQAAIPQWVLPSEPYGADFTSPQRSQDDRPRRPRPGPSYGRYMGAVPYGGGPGYRSLWRPEKPLSLEEHQRLSNLLYQVQHSGAWYGRIHNKLMGVYARVAAWMAREHDSILADDVYYGSNPRSLVDSAEVAPLLEEAITIIERGYNECRPRRELLSTIHRAAAAIQAG